MRDRLIELITQKQNWGQTYEKSIYTRNISNSELANYLLANGVIVPPCWIGDKIYFVCGNNMAEYTIERAEYDLLFWQFHCENPAYCIEHREFSFFDERIGKTVFLTKEEAEAKLKGRCK